jgi:NAD(P)H dehydrogenase (quinone)
MAGGVRRHGTVCVNVLWVFAHPEPCSLGAGLRDDGVRALGEAGHACRQSDLYAMKWKATLDRDDFVEDDCLRPEERVLISAESKRAFQEGTLSPDIRCEQEKIDWADAIVLQFPLWWYGMPAILKGWFDRVFVKGYAYGVVDPDDPRRTLRYGDGTLAGKRALLIVSSGSPEAALGPRGINGQLDQVLFPLLHGTLWYTGMTVLPPVPVFGADRVGPEQFEAAAALVRERVTTIADTRPIPYRHQNGGDYDDDLVLLPEHAQGTSGLGVHQHP